MRPSRIWIVRCDISATASEWVTITEEEITCLTDSFNITREQLEILMSSRQPGQTSSSANPCMTEDTYARILITMLGPQVGGLSEETSTRIKQVAAKHPHFFELARAGTYDAEAMSQDQFVEIVEDGLRLYHCMTDDELRALQREAAHVLATFGESAAGHEQ